MTFDNYNFNFDFQPTPQSYHQARHYSWNEAWTQALTNPQEATYWWLVRDPVATSGRAMQWIIVGWGLFAICQAISQFIFASLYRDLFVANESYFWSEPSLARTILLTPLQIFFLLMITIMMMLVSHIVAHALNGKGTLEQTIYGLSTIVAPIAVIGGVLSFIPIMGSLLWLLLLVYGFVLAIVALRGIHAFNWLQALITALAPIIAGTGLCFCCTFCLLAMA